MSIEKPDNSNPASAPELKNVSRRKFLKTGLKATGGILAAGVAGAGYMEFSAGERSRSLKEITAFLRGKSKEKLLIFGKEFNYQQFCDLIMRMVEPPLESKQALSELLNSFCYMMEVEDQFAGSLNVLPELEHLETIREKYFSGLLQAIGLDKKEQLTNSLLKIVKDLSKKIDKYSEVELDEYLLPHPLLGKLTVREMLFFTIHHVEQHQKITLRNLGR